MEPPSLRIDLRIDRREPQIIPIKGNNYSHLGNKTFPAWEHNIPKVGINSASSIARFLKRYDMSGKT